MIGVGYRTYIPRGSPAWHRATRSFGSRLEDRAMPRIANASGGAYARGLSWRSASGRRWATGC